MPVFCTLFRCLLLLCLSLSRVFAWTGLTPQVSVWDASLSGELGSGAATGQIRKKSTQSIGLGLKIHVLGFNSTLEYRPLSLNTAINPSGAFQFRGTAYNATDRLNADVRWDSYDWQGRFFSLGTDSGRVDFISGLQVTRLGIQLNAANRVARSELSETLLIPYAGVRTEVKMTNHFSFHAQAKVLDLNLGGHRFDYLDADLGVRYSFAKNSDMLGSLTLGYQRREANIILDQNRWNQASLNLQWSGPYAAWRIHF